MANYPMNSAIHPSTNWDLMRKNKSSSKVSRNVLSNPLQDATRLAMVHLPPCPGHREFLHQFERQSTSTPSHLRRCTATVMRAGTAQAAQHGKLLCNCSHHTGLFFDSL